MKGFCNAHIGNFVSCVLVAIEEAVLGAEISEHADLVDGVDFEGNRVEDESRDGMKAVAGVVDIELVKNHGPNGVDNDPEMGLPMWKVWHFVGLLVDWNVLAVDCRMEAEYLNKPVMVSPCLSIGFSPCRLHGVLRICSGCSHVV